MMPMGFGDDMLHFNGIGERITWAMNNVNGLASEADRQKYYDIVKWAASRGMTVTMHWGNDKNVDQLLTIFERVNKDVPIAPLRWTIAHLNNASPQTLQRMKALGMGWTVQDEMYNGGDQVLKQEGAEAARRSRRSRRPKNRVAVSAGTDAQRVSTCNPFTCCRFSTQD
jgi:predicted amidohydrolase YtcJ